MTGGSGSTCWLLLTDCGRNPKKGVNTVFSCGVLGNIQALRVVGEGVVT